MKFIQKISAICVVALALTACNSHPDNFNFDKALVTGYTHFANYKANHATPAPNATDIEHFQMKAQKPAARAKAEDLKNWDLLPFHYNELAAARERLVIALSNQNRETFPVHAGRAQVSFDCWVEKAEQKWDLLAIERCRNSFYESIRILENAMQAQYPLQVQEEAQPNLPPVAQIVSRPQPKPSEVIYFDFDSDKLKTSESSKLKAISDYVKSTDDSKIKLDGHTDRAGSDKYNDDLSKRRANTVKKSLETMGVDSDLIESEAHGESQPAIQTNDGVKEPKNRRVNIKVK